MNLFDFSEKLFNYYTHLHHKKQTLCEIVNVTGFRAFLRIYQEFPHRFPQNRDFQNNE